MKKIYLLHPLLFAIYPIIFLYSHNVQELLFRQIYFPLSFSLLGTVLLFLLLNSLFKNSYRVSLIVSIFMVAFFTYGYLFESLQAWNQFTIKHRFAFPVYVLITGYLSYFVFRVKSDEVVEKLCAIVTIVAITLVVVNLINIVPFEIKKNDIARQSDMVANDKANQLKPATRPDVYYIIIDEYASLSTIKKIWNYDSSQFANYLEAKGFYIARGSTTKLPQTDKAIPSYLNMNYVNENSSTIERFNMLNNSKVINSFRNKGYKTIAFDNWYTINNAKGLMNVDTNYNFLFEGKMSNVDQFTIILVNTTMLKPFSYLFEVEFNDLNNLHRNSTLFTFNKLPKIVNVKSPKFVYAHILCPHTPFTFGRNGEEVHPANGYNWKDKKYYLDQYIFTSRQIERTVDLILKNSQNPPIIIIQSDHGPTPEIPINPDERLYVPAEESSKIFLAYYLPSGGNKELNNYMSPVNTFRIIFNKYFNENYQLLED